MRHRSTPAALFLRGSWRGRDAGEEVWQVRCPSPGPPQPRSALDCDDCSAWVQPRLSSSSGKGCESPGGKERDRETEFTAAPRCRWNCGRDGARTATPHALFSFFFFYFFFYLCFFQFLIFSLSVPQTFVSSFLSCEGVQMAYTTYTHASMHTCTHKQKETLGAKYPLFSPILFVDLFIYLDSLSWS